MLKKILVLSLILTFKGMAIEPSYYQEVEALNDRMYFPKTDTRYIDELVKSDFEDRNYELAVAYLKLGKAKTSGKYIQMYEVNGDPKKLVDYYKMARNYTKLETYLDELLETQDRDGKIKYKILIEDKIIDDSIPLNREKYQVNRIEKLVYLRDRDDEFKEFFNSNRWNQAEIDKIVKELSNMELSGKAKELFDMFASDDQKLEKEYRRIQGVEDINGYMNYYTYATTLGIKPQIKMDIENIYYLSYLEDKTLDLEIDKLVKTYILEEDREKLKIIYNFRANNLAKDYLLSVDDEVAYFDLLDRGAEEEVSSKKLKYLDTYPESKYYIEVYRDLFVNGSDETKDYLITRYPNTSLEVIDEYKYSKLMVEEKKIYLKEKIAKGDLAYLDRYVLLLEETGIEVERELRDINVEAYFRYQEKNNQDIDKVFIDEYIEYLVEKGDRKFLYKYRENLTKNQLESLSKGSKEMLDYYKLRYPLETIDETKFRYIYFSDTPKIEQLEAKVMESKEELTPQENYLLAVYYYDIEDFVSSYRSTLKLIKKYKLSDRIYNLYFNNIEKIKEGEGN